MSFQDHFSKQAEEYSKYRPKYPDELFNYLSSLTKEHELAWDCACGNGQASNGLAKYYDKVIATDASKTQLSHAVQNPKIQYVLAAAENSGLGDGIADLVTVATAIHWLDTDKFYPEVKRILKPEGIIALWGYSHSNITPEINAIIREFSDRTINNYWPGNNKKAWDFENSIDFPFKRISTPDFYITREWTLEDYLNYLYTWSSVQKYIEANKSNPLNSLQDSLFEIWGGESRKRDVSWKLDIKVGLVNY